MLGIQVTYPLYANLVTFWKFFQDHLLTLLIHHLQVASCALTPFLGPLGYCATSSSAHAITITLKVSINAKVLNSPYNGLKADILFIQETNFAK